MEKKDWRWRLYKLLVYIDVDCGEQELGFAIGIEGVEKLEKLVERELDKAREEGKREVFSQEELKILMWLVRDRKQGIDWNYKTKRISEWDKLVSDGLFNKLEGLSKLKDNK